MAKIVSPQGQPPSGVAVPSDAGSGETTADAKTYNRDPARSEFIGFSRGGADRDRVFSFDKSGAVISRRLTWPEEPAASRSQQNQFRLPLDISGTRDYPILPLGLVIVSGGTGVGKSSFLRALATQVDILRLLAVEPHDTGEEVADVATFSSVDGALAAAIAAAYTAPTVLPALDSLRAPLFETTGAAGPKGMSMPFFTQVTRVSNCLARSGITVLATVNPMNNEADYVASFLEKLSASVPATILLESYTRQGEIETFKGTISMRPDRAKLGFTFQTGAPKIVRREELISEVSFDPADVAPSSVAARHLYSALKK